MGVIERLLGLQQAASGIGQAVEGVAEVFVPNATKKMTLSQEAYLAALSQHGVEFKHIREGWFDRLMNGLNRLPRPALALGTLGLFAYAMVSPENFSVRMQGLALVPEPLWWLLGAVVSFYFGAREMHYFRASPRIAGFVPPVAATDIETDNAALADWRAANGA